MDVCTLTAAVMVTTVFCAPPVVCDTEPVDGKILCRPSFAAVDTCNKRVSPQYQCLRPDGTIYHYTPPEK